MTFLLHPPRCWNYCNASPCHSQAERNRHKLCAVCHWVEMWAASRVTCPLPSWSLLTLALAPFSQLRNRHPHIYTSFKRRQLWVAWNPSRKTNNKGQTRFKSFLGLIQEYSEIESYVRIRGAISTRQSSLILRKITLVYNLQHVVD